jgi:hypothetical protein
MRDASSYLARLASNLQTNMYNGCMVKSNWKPKEEPPVVSALRSVDPQFDGLGTQYVVSSLLRVRGMDVWMRRIRPPASLGDPDRARVRRSVDQVRTVRSGVE